jgi:hypothetical protein
MSRSARAAWLFVPVFSILLAARPGAGLGSDRQTPIRSHGEASVDGGRVPIPFALVPWEDAAAAFADRPRPADGSAHATIGGRSNPAALDLDHAPTGVPAFEAARSPSLSSGAPRAPPSLPLS